MSASVFLGLAGRFLTYIQVTHLKCTIQWFLVHSSSSNFTVFLLPEKETLYPLAVAPRIPPISLAPGNPYCTFGLYKFPILGILYEQNHTVHGLL